MNLFLCCLGFSVRTHVLVSEHALTGSARAFTKRRDLHLATVLNDGPERVARSADYRATASGSHMT
ncbi:hypothetical protein DOTSEDRAFT_75348 [Dothistroma septosporum NZE10]|uniref:Uncharacterized protein n=1 Tax=Dothistroma septosporum (strain NZE10 / CBS 128990) TaxID=675120 RepID=M2XJN0_DOTSN|nr:hypothetical protein DOTSEDRAFT_75348 [Dothistroma septosporum NZE10]